MSDGTDVYDVVVAAIRRGLTSAGETHLAAKIDQDRPANVIPSVWVRYGGYGRLAPELAGDAERYRVEIYGWRTDVPTGAKQKHCRTIEKAIRDELRQVVVIGDSIPFTAVDLPASSKGYKVDGVAIPVVMKLRSSS